MWLQKIRDSTLSNGESMGFLSHLGLVRYRVVPDRQTDAQTDRITIASTRLALPLRAVARKNQTRNNHHKRKRSKQRRPSHSGHVAS